jgi:ubiquinone/menaquinone biosynthesis C-methylase UbiE
LEIGPGPGRLLIPAAQRVQPHDDVVGLDIQPAMIARLQETAEAVGVTNLVGFVGDAATTSPPGEFDVVILATALGEIPNRDAALRRCFNAFKPGGVLSVTEMLPDPHFVSRRTVRRLAE